jgi:hypothetical protein
VTSGPPRYDAPLTMTPAPHPIPPSTPRLAALRQAWLADLRVQEQHADAIGPPPPHAEIDPLSFYVRRHAAAQRRSLDDLAARLPLHWLRLFALPPTEAHRALVRMGVCVAAAVASQMNPRLATQWLAPLGPALGRELGQTLALGTLPEVGPNVVARWRELFEELSLEYQGPPLARQIAASVLAGPLRAFLPEPLNAPADRAHVAATILNARATPVSAQSAGAFVAWLLSNIPGDGSTPDPVMSSEKGRRSQ